MRAFAPPSACLSPRTPTLSSLKELPSRRTAIFAFHCFVRVHELSWAKKHCVTGKLERTIRRSVDASKVEGSYGSNNAARTCIAGGSRARSEVTKCRRARGAAVSRECRISARVRSAGLAARRCGARPRPRPAHSHTRARRPHTPSSTPVHTRAPPHMCHITYITYDASFTVCIFQYLRFRVNVTSRIYSACTHKQLS